MVRSTGNLSSMVKNSCRMPGSFGYSPLATRYPYIVNLAIMIRTRFFDGFGFP